MPHRDPKSRFPRWRRLPAWTWWSRAHRARATPPRPERGNLLRPRTLRTLATPTALHQAPHGSSRRRSTSSPTPRRRPGTPGRPHTLEPIGLAHPLEPPRRGPAEVGEAARSAAASFQAGGSSSESFLQTHLIRQRSLDGRLRRGREVLPFPESRPAAAGGRLAPLGNAKCARPADALTDPLWSRRSAPERPLCRPAR